MRTIQSFMLLGFVLLAGCVTDKLVVFQKGLLSDEEMKPFLGEWTLTRRLDWDGKKRAFRKGTLALAKKGLDYHFLMELDDDRWSADHFLLSKIPNSKSGLLLLSSPKVDSCENFFGIAKQDNGTLYFWVVCEDQPMAKGRLSIQDGSFRASDVESFLEKHADAFIRANSPNFTFKKT